MLPPPDTTSPAATSSDAAVASSGSLNFKIGSPNVESGTIHIESKNNDGVIEKYDLPFTVAGGETPDQFADRIGNALREDGFVVNVVAGEITVTSKNRDPITGIGAAVTSSGGKVDKLKPGTIGNTQGLEPVYDMAGKITGWQKYRKITLEVGGD